MNENEEQRWRNIQKRIRNPDVFMSKPETVTFTASMISFEFGEIQPENFLARALWKSKPKLPHDLSEHLFKKNIAYVVNVQAMRKECGSVIDQKPNYSFHIDLLKTELLRLGYHIRKESAQEVVFSFR